MVNTRSKIKKIRTTRLFSSSSEVSVDPDDDHYSFILSAAMVASIDDLLIEILFHLPARSILRFKSVSKHWLSLITDRRFILRHTSIPRVPRGLFLHTLYIPFDNENPSNARPPFRALNFYPDIRGIRILQSCNGLLLCSSHLGNEGASRYYVCNPTTGKSVILPIIPSGRDVRKYVCGMALAFDPSKSPHYKVICVHEMNTESGLYQIQIYSSDKSPTRIKGSRRISGEPFYANLNTHLQGGVYWNGAIHWTCSSGDSIYFNVDEERVVKMPMPPFPNGYQGCWAASYFGVSGDHLHLVETRGDSYMHFNVYEMERDHSGWFVKYEVDLDEFPGEFPAMVDKYSHLSSMRYKLQIFGVVREEREESSFMVVDVPGKVVRYNLADKTFENIFEFDWRDKARPYSYSIHGRYGNSITHMYVESLSPV